MAIPGSRAVRVKWTRGQLRCMIRVIGGYIPVCLRTPMREIAEQAACDGLRGIRLTGGDLGEGIPIRRGSRLPMEVLPRVAVWVVGRQAYGQAF